MPEITDWPIDNLHEYGNNPRKITRKAVDAVAKSIVAYGSCVPIVAASDGEIVAGHVRFRAAKQLGLTTFPVIVADGLSAQQIKAYRIADNKIRSLSKWDKDLLQVELYELRQLAADPITIDWDSLKEMAAPEPVDYQPESFAVLVECKSGEEQRAVFEEAKRRGRKVRVLTS